jgi:WD40 repeat protein
VYSLGVVLYELLTGSSPYGDRERGLEGVGVDEIGRRILDGNIVPVHAREPEAPRDLVTITERALAVDPAKRYPSAKALVEDLARFVAGQLISRRYTSGELVRRWLRRHTRIVAVAAAAIVALVTVGAMAAIRVGLARRAAQASMAHLELDEGRLAYLGGDPLLALAYIAAAIRDGADGTVARYVLARASAEVEPQLLVIEAHRGGAYVANFSPDGRWLATAGDDNAAIWDAATGARRHVLEGHRGAVFAAEWSPDGRRLVTAGLDGVIRVWDPQDGRLVAGLEGHRGYVPGVRFSPDGAQLVSWDLMGGVRSWDVATGVERFAIAAHKGRIAQVQFDRSGTWLLSTGRDGQGKVWSAATGALSCSGEGAEGMVSGGFSPDGSRFVTGSNDSVVEVHDTADCKLRLRFRVASGELTVARFDPSGQRILTAGFDALRLWDASTGELLHSLQENAAIQTAAFSGDGDRVVTGGYERQLRMWNARDGRPLGLLAGHDAQVRSVAWSPDQQRVASASADGTVRVWRASQSAISRAPSGLRLLHPEGDEHILAVEMHTGDLLRFDRAGHAWSKVAPAVCPWMATKTSPANVVCILGDGVVLRARDGVAELIDVATGQVRWRDPVERVMAAALGPRSRLAATVGARGDVRVSDAASGAEVHTFHLEQRIMGVALLENDRLVTVGPAEIAVWDARSGDRLMTLPGATLARDAPSVPADLKRNRILVASTDRGGAIHHVTDGAVVATLHGQRATVHDGIFSPDGTLVVTRQVGEAARVWDVATGLQLDVIAYGSMGDIAFDPGRQELLTVDLEGELQSWPLDRDRRSVAAIEDFVDACVPYRVEQGKVVARVLDRTRCHPTAAR